MVLILRRSKSRRRSAADFSSVAWCQDRSGGLIRDCYPTYRTFDVQCWPQLTEMRSLPRVALSRRCGRAARLCRNTSSATCAPVECRIFVGCSRSPCSCRDYNNPLGSRKTLQRTLISVLLVRHLLEPVDHLTIESFGNINVRHLA